MSGAMRTHEMLAAFCVLLALGTGEAAAQSNCATMRKINIGVSVAPPNVVHTSSYVAFELGLFAKHCIDANIIQFDRRRVAGGARAAAVRRAPLWSRPARWRSGHGVKVQADLGFGAACMPQDYVVQEAIKTAADLKGKKLSATGGGKSAASIG